MAIELYRIDDRLIHGQVIVGWGQPMGLGFLVLVDDEVARSEWEQELYRMGVPPGLDVFFASVADATTRLDEWNRDRRPGILLTSDIDTMTRLIDATSSIRAVNLGGIHHRAGRVERLRYLYLTGEEVRALLALERRGVVVTARDVPASRPVSLNTLMDGNGEEGAA
ncbi:MAG: PTS system mannose/fructose/N-acetylgalactosamine-transporter subunit IIB [Gemmatimonadales bacterium]